MRHDWAGLTSRAGPPIDVPLSPAGNAGKNVSAVVLLGCIQPIREAVVEVTRAGRRFEFMVAIPTLRMQLAPGCCG